VPDERTAEPEVARRVDLDLTKHRLEDGQAQRLAVDLSAGAPLVDPHRQTIVRRVDEQEVPIGEGQLGEQGREHVGTRLEQANGSVVGQQELGDQQAVAVVAGSAPRIAASSGSGPAFVTSTAIRPNGAVASLRTTIETVRAATDA
jgi:hypothetical protein